MSTCRRFGNKCVYGRVPLRVLRMPECAGRATATKARGTRAVGAEVIRGRMTRTGYRGVHGDMVA